jgi:hypothetical protein
MTPQPPTNNPSEKPPADLLTEAERAELIRARDEAQKLFEKLLEQDRQPESVRLPAKPHQAPQR